MEKEDVIRKIRALLNRTTENGASINEAEIALEKARKLMKEYMIEKHQLENEDFSCIEKTIRLKRQTPIITEFMSYLARTFDCEFFYNLHCKRCTFFGFPIEVEVCVYFYDLIFNSLESGIKNYKLSEEYYRLTKCNYGYYSPKTVIISYIVGFLESIWDKLTEIRNERNAIKHSTGTSLVIVRKEAVKAELEKAHPELRTRDRSTSRVTKQPLLSGRNDGEKVQLNYGISSEMSESTAINSVNTKQIGMRA